MSMPILRRGLIALKVVDLLLMVQKKNKITNQEEDNQKKISKEAFIIKFQSYVVLKWPSLSMRTVLGVNVLVLCWV